jgi:hypothetical protein
LGTRSNRAFDAHPRLPSSCTAGSASEEGPLTQGEPVACLRQPPAEVDTNPLALRLFTAARTSARRARTARLAAEAVASGYALRNATNSRVWSSFTGPTPARSRSVLLAQTQHRPRIVAPASRPPQRDRHADYDPRAHARAPSPAAGKPATEAAPDQPGDARQAHAAANQFVDESEKRGLPACSQPGKRPQRHPPRQQRHKQPTRNPRWEPLPAEPVVPPPRSTQRRTPQAHPCLASCPSGPHRPPTPTPPAPLPQHQPHPARLRYEQKTERTDQALALLARSTRAPRCRSRDTATKNHAPCGHLIEPAHGTG